MFVRQPNVQRETASGTAYFRTPRGVNCNGLDEKINGEFSFGDADAVNATGSPLEAFLICRRRTSNAIATAPKTATTIAAIEPPPKPLDGGADGGGGAPGGDGWLGGG